jgi:hypothetical protein
MCKIFPISSECRASAGQCGIARCARWLWLELMAMASADCRLAAGAQKLLLLATRIFFQRSSGCARQSREWGLSRRLSR